MAKQLAGVEASHVFFAAYLQGDSEQANWDTNGAMLHNFISALSETGATKLLKRFILVTGAKQYGLHLGRVKTPMEESDPRIDGPGRPPNFYYRQQDILAEEVRLPRPFKASILTLSRPTKAAGIGLLPIRMTLLVSRRTIS